MDRWREDTIQGALAAEVRRVYGEHIRRRRLTRQWSQLDLALKLAEVAQHPTLTRHEISRWERGMRVPGRFWREHLVQVLELDPGALAHLPGRALAPRRRPRPRITNPRLDIPGLDGEVTRLLSEVDSTMAELRASARRMIDLASCMEALPAAAVHRLKRRR